MPISRIPSGMLSALLLLVLPCVSEAAKSFFYNEDIECGYPFDDFTINSITCTDSGSNTYVSGEYDQERDEYDQESYEYNLNADEYEQYRDEFNRNRNADDGFCWFGQTMDVAGEVNLLEPVYRYFKVKLKVCFQNNDYGYYHYHSYAKCFTYQKKIDLMADGQRNRYLYTQNNDYLEEGRHEFQTSLTIPKKSFTFKEGTLLTLLGVNLSLVCSITRVAFSFPSFSIMTGYIVKADLTFYPEEAYHGAGYFYMYDSYNYKTMCHTTFAAGDDGDVENTQNKYHYWAVGGLITCFTAAAALYGAKRRHLITCFDQESITEDSDEGDVDAQVTNFKKMIDEKFVQMFDQESNTEVTKIEMMIDEKSVPARRQSLVRRLSQRVRALRSVILRGVVGSFRMGKANNEPARIIELRDTNCSHA